MTTADFAKMNDIWQQMARSFTNDTELAKDLVQELYLKLLQIEKKEGSLDHICQGTKPNTTWAYTVLNHLFIDHIRKQKKMPEHREMVEIAAEPEIQTQEKKLTALWKAVAEMNKQPATSYECRYFLYYVTSGKSLRQLAKESNTTVWVVQNAINNAKQKINLAITASTAEEGPQEK